MPGTSKVEAKKTWWMAAILAIAVLAIILFASLQETTHTAKNSGGAVRASETNEMTQCIKYCLAAKQAGVTITKNTCLSVNLNGVGCSVSLDGNSACSSAGRLPQIVLTPDCRPWGERNA